MAEDNGMTYIEVSAKKGTNIEAAFMKLVEAVHTKIQSGTIDPRLESSGVRVGSDKIGAKPSENHKLVANPPTKGNANCAC